jgi:hypothetical protein
MFSDDSFTGTSLEGMSEVSLRLRARIQVHFASLSSCGEKGGNRAMKPMRQGLLVDGNPADATPEREASTGGRFQSCRMSVESLLLFAGSSGCLG